MHVNTSIGEASAEFKGKTYLLRPSFRALKRIDYLEDSITSVCGSYNLLINGQNVTTAQVSVCAYVLQCCSDLPDDLVGWSEHRNGKFKWVMKVLTISEIVIMAHHCIKWGVFGDPKEKLSKAAKKQIESKPQSEFDPHDFVSIMIDEFNVSTNDAWDCTMVEFQRLCEHRNRKNWGDRPDPIDDDEREVLINQYEACMKRKQELNKNG